MKTKKVDGLIGEFFVQKMREQDEKIRYDMEADMSTKTITQMIEELAKMAEQKAISDREKARTEKAAAEKRAVDEAWEEIIAEAASAANEGVVDAGDIIDEICRMREEGMSAPSAKRMIRAIIRQEREELERVQRAAPKPAAYGSWA